jgi:hypothetical protein
VDCSGSLTLLCWVVTGDCRSERVWDRPVRPPQPVAVWGVDDLRPLPVEDRRTGHDLVRPTRCDQPADRSPEPLSFILGCACSRSRDALRIVMVLSSRATALRSESCSRSIMVCSRCPARRSTGLVHRLRPAPRPLTRRSGDSVPGVSPMPGLGVQRSPPRRLPHRLTTQQTPTYLARNPGIRPRTHPPCRLSP